MAELDTLEIRIESNAESAQKSIKGLADAVKTLKSSLSRGIKGVEEFTSALDQIKAAANGIDSESVRKLSDLAAAAERLSKVNVSKTAKNIRAISKALAVVDNGLSGTSKSAGGFFGNINNRAKQAIDNVKLLTSGAKGNMVSANTNSDGLFNDLFSNVSSKGKSFWEEFYGNFEQFGGGVLGGFAESIFTQFPKLGDAIKTIENDIKLLGKGFNGVGIIVGRVLGKVAVEAAKDFIKTLQDVIGYLGKIGNSITNAFKNFASGSLKSAISGIKTVISTIGNSTPIAKFAKSIKGIASSIKNLVSSLARIGMYRILRTVFKDVSSALEDAIQQLYKFDQGLGGAFSKNMDTITQNVQNLKASLGTLAANIINILSPAINAAVNIMTTLADGISQLVAVLGGNVFYKATASAATYADTLSESTSAAKEWENQLMGFDEINKLTDSSGSGSSGSSSSSIPIDYQQMTELPDWLKKIQELLSSEQWQEAGDALASHLNGILKSFNAVEWGENLGKKIQNGIKFAIGFFENSDLFDTAGEKLAGLINGIFHEVDGVTIGQMMAAKLNAAVRAINSFVTNIESGAIGKEIGESVQSWFENLDTQSINLAAYNALHKVIVFMQNYMGSFSLGYAVNKISSSISQGLNDAADLISATNIINSVIGWIDEIDWEGNATKLGTGIGKLANAIIHGFDWKEVGDSIGIKIRAALGLAKSFMDEFDFSSFATGLVTGIKTALQDTATAIRETDLAGELSSDLSESNIGSLINSLFVGVSDVINAITEQIKEVNNSGVIRESIESAASALTNSVIDLTLEIWKAKWQARSAAFFGVIEGILGTSGEIEAEELGSEVTLSLEEVVQKARNAGEELGNWAMIITAYASEANNYSSEYLGQITAEWEAMYPGMSAEIDYLVGKYANISTAADNAASSVSGTNSKIEEAADSASDASNLAIAVDNQVSTTMANAAAKNEEIQSVTAATAAAIKQEITDAIAQAKQDFDDTFSEMADKVEAFKDSAARSLDDFKLAMMNTSVTVTSYCNQMISAIESVKTAWASSWGNPTVTVPRLRAYSSLGVYTTGSFDAYVDWQYMANGGIVDGATPIIAGEAGKEAIIPLENNTGWIDSVANQLKDDDGDADNSDIISAIIRIGNQIVSSINSKETDVTLDGMSMARKMYKYNKIASSEAGISLVNA